MLVSENPKDGKFDDLKTFKNQKLENHFKPGLEIIILKSKGKSLRGWYMAQQVAMLEVTMHTCLKGLIWSQLLQTFCMKHVAAG